MASGGKLVVTMLTDNGWLNVAPRLSIARTVTLNTPLVVGVPAITPFIARFNPNGRLPENKVQLYGAPPKGTPLLACIGAL